MVDERSSGDLCNNHVVKQKHNEQLRTAGPRGRLCHALARVGSGDSMNADQCRDASEVRPLARSLTELTVVSVVALISGALGLAALLVLENASKVLGGCVLGIAVVLGAWLPMTSLVRAQRRKRAAPQPLRPAPREAPREERSATVRRMLSGRVKVFPLFVLLVLMPSIALGPSPGNAAIAAGATVGCVLAGAVENFRRALRLARWEHRHQQRILVERPSYRPSSRRSPRRMYSESWKA